MVASNRGCPPKVKPAKMGPEDVHIQMLAEQRKTNQLLMMLIDALSEDDELDEEGEPITYLDGTPV